MAEIRYLHGRIVLQVYLLDNSKLTVLIEPTTTVHDVSEMLARKIGFADPEDDCLAFSLHECRDGITIERALPSEQVVLDKMQEWVDENLENAKFVYQCKLFTESIMETTDPKVIKMIYIQTVYNVITGTYPTNQEDAVKLAALQLYSKFGEYKPDVHKPGFLTRAIVEYVPGPHLANDGLTVEEWERRIFAQHAMVETTTPQKDYIGILKQRDYFGCVLFAVKQYYDRTAPKKIFLGISRQGILLLRIPRSFTQGEMETLARYPLGDIYRWAYKPGETFYFEVKTPHGGDFSPEYRFVTPEGKSMSDLLTDYAMALLREMGLNPDGSKRAKKTPEAPAAERIPRSKGSLERVEGEAGRLAVAATRSGAAEAAEPAAAGGGGGGAAAPASGPPERKPKAGTRPPPTKKPVMPPPPQGAPPTMPPPPPPPPPEEEEEEEEHEEVPEREPTPPAPAPAPVEEAEEEEEAVEEAQEEEEQLPPNWTKEWDADSQLHYYFNAVTGESQWEPPTE